ncbi:MAG: hypothetical protein EPN38_12875 [Rhodanobacteraceae bacterium]|nr:MAG: hypothetical protein EPN38_12875 [Rhodanobacteraceae bacterium]
MKRHLLAPLVLATITLAGCQTIRAHNPFRHTEPAYKAAQQEQPLEVPPGMDTPPSADALTIPDTGSAPPATAAQPESGPAPAAAGRASNSLTFADAPDSVYHRVGLALARGDVGQVTAHDDTAHTYSVAVDTVVEKQSTGGFFHRLFHHSQNENVKGTVSVSVEPSGTGSVVTAQGAPDAVARVIGMLQQRLQ